MSKETESKARMLSDRPSGEWGFWSLILTQFQGAFSDNAYKYLLIFTIASSQVARDDRDFLVLVVGVLFAAPFVLFSMAGGYLADRFSKRSVTIATKGFEIFVMLLALVGLASENLVLQLTAVFLLGAQSAFFGPSKYGLLPEVLPEKKLSWGNGILEFGTFAAIITGTVTGGLLSATFKQQPAMSGLILVGLAILGLITSLGIDRVAAADVRRTFRWNFLLDLSDQIRLMSKDRVLWLAVVGNVYFFFLAALLQFNIVFYGTDILGVSETQNGYLQAAVAIGIGIGSVVAGYLSGGKIEYGLIPLGAIGMSFFGALLYRVNLSFAAVAVNLSIVGFFAGFFIVPVSALIQHRPAPDKKGSVIAAANLLSFVGIFLASGVYYLLSSRLGLSPPAIFLCGAILTLGATVYILVLLPHAFVRLLLWFFTHTIYRIRIQGRDHIPEKGGALFVSNHLSFVDALLLAASTDRRVRFLMFQDLYDRRWVKPFARLMDAIPISSNLRPKEMLRSLRQASDAIRRGRVVCIFAEGQISRIGQLLPFRRGFERIMKDVDAPIVPVHLDGLWGSVFSFERGRFFWKLPRTIPYPVTASFGQPLPPTSKAFDVRQAVQELSSKAFELRKERMRSLPRAFVRNSKTHPFRFSMADARVPRLRAGASLMRTVFLARRLRPLWNGDSMVGILLPPSVPGALVNFAALLAGKVPVNLNYTLSSEAMASCARQCGIRTVVTSRAFLDQVPLRVPGRALLLEDVAALPRKVELLVAVFMAFLFPVKLLERKLGRSSAVDVDDVATVIFSSGSTGEPKGVLLSHYNICSNVDQLGQVFALDENDRVLGILPFFHSFGFTGTFALPLAMGVGVVFHPNPLDAAAIGPLVRRYAVTFMLSTPTFLTGYMRRCEPEDFGSLDYVLVGAEKLHDRVALAFEDRFGIRPLEAYGCTECAPGVTVNTRDYRAAGYRQVGGKRGRIGHPLPGISVRVVDPDTPDTMESLGPDLPGLLLVKGPNVMKGYLDRPDKTSEVMRDGWYCTGDIATIDSDGFLTITDRLSRFSKIGGEMVPHIKVEEELQQVANLTEPCFAVTGVPDEKKGERLVVLHTLPDAELQRCLEQLSKSDLPNLWIPKPNAFFRVPSFPYLGTGKMDLRKMRQLALERCGMS